LTVLRGRLELEVERRRDLQAALERAPRAEAVDELLAHPGREVRRLRPDRRRLDVAGQRLLAALKYCRRRERPARTSREHEVAPRLRALRVRDGVVRARVGDDAGQQRRLLGRSTLDARARGVPQPGGRLVPK
jgi:hypothetical protein